MEGYEIERERKRVWSKKKPPLEVVVVMSQPCRFGLVSGVHFWDTIIFLSFFPLCFAIYTEFYFEHKHNITIGIFTFLLFHGYNKCEFDAKINLNFFYIIIVRFCPI